MLFVLFGLFVLFYVLFVCKCLLPPGDNSTAVNKYINIWEEGGLVTFFLNHGTRCEEWSGRQASHVPYM